MEIYARFSDGQGVNEEVFETLAKFAPDGHLDVLACDQHNSILKLLTSFFKNAWAKSGDSETFPEKPGNEDVIRASQMFARALGKVPAAALFNHFGFLTYSFKDLLGSQTMLIGRLEDTNFLKAEDGGLVAQLAMEPEKIADKVDAFKTLVKVDPALPESWKSNLEWLKQIYERCRKLGKPLFNETLYNPSSALTKVQAAAKLRKVLVKIANDFSPFGDFYKTQVPLLWIEENGKIVNMVSPDIVRETAKIMTDIVARPILVLSAAVDFQQYAAQYACVCDLVSGPMCGRAYFKDPFSDPGITTWEELEKALENVAAPRMRQIKELARAKSKPWWCEFEWISDKAKKLIKTS